MSDSRIRTRERLHYPLKARLRQRGSFVRAPLKDRLTLPQSVIALAPFWVSRSRYYDGACVTCLSQTIAADAFSCGVAARRTVSTFAPPRLLAQALAPHNPTRERRFLLRTRRAKGGVLNRELDLLLFPLAYHEQ